MARYFYGQYFNFITFIRINLQLFLMTQSLYNKLMFSADKHLKNVCLLMIIINLIKAITQNGK